MSAQRFEAASRLDVDAEELFAWHARPGAFERLVPPWQRLEVVDRSGGLEEGSRWFLRLAKGPLALRWVAEIQDVRLGQGFRDVQIEGPFAYWEHEHAFEASEGDRGTWLRDTIRYALPGGFLGAAVAGRSIRADLERTFRYRHRTTAADLELHGRFRSRPRLRVAVSGASGLIGRALASLLASGGHRVVPLVRQRSDDESAGVLWHPERGVLEPQRLEGLDAVVHLAGENIAAGRWTPARKAAIRDSRVAGTRHLVDSLAGLESPPRILVCASAIGYYGDRGKESLDETSSAGDGFLPEVVAAWESEAARAARFGARAVMARFGVVLSPAGGALAKMLPAFRAGLGGVLGSGEQIVSWIGIDDAAGALLHVLMQDDLEGPINVAAPTPVGNRALTRALGRVLRRPTVAPLPAFAARLLFGEMADAALLASTSARSRKLQESGYRFRHDTLDPALGHLFGRPAEEEA